MKINRIKKSIKFKILVPMLLFLVLQTIFILSIFFASNIVKTSTLNAYSSFNDKVITRKTYTEKEMLQRFASVDNAIGSINQIIQEMLEDSQNNGVDYGKNKGNVFLTKSCPLLINTIKTNGVTGAYIILADSGQDMSSVDGVYLRCESPLAAVADSIYINVAPTYVRENALQGNATNETNTLTAFDFSSKSSDYDYFYKPYNAVISSELLTTVSEYYSYWAAPHHILLGGASVISYSVPLFYNDRLYGVFGIDVSLRYLEKYLPQAELNADNQASYALCSYVGDGSYTTMLKSGTFYMTALGDTQTISLNECKHGIAPYNYSIKAGKNDCCVCVVDLNLYANNSYKYGEKITLMGIINRDAIMSFTNRMTKTIVISLLATAVAGAVLVVLVALYISKPIARLPLKIDEYSKNISQKIQRTGVYEIDALIDSIEQLSVNVTENASKMSKIIELTGAPLGAFEYNKTNNVVIFTDKVADIMNNPLLVTGKIAPQQFIEYISNIENHRVETEDSAVVYSFITDTGETRFITLQTVETDNYLIGVLQDVTKERIDRTRIKYERDYDVLTSLLNRRAFLAVSKKLFSGDKNEIGYAALVLIDMDNLKVINDTFGHECGDEYLRIMAKTLKAFLAETKAFISRYSGDEYVMLLYGCDSKASLRDVILKVESYVRDSYMTMANGQKVKLRCSGGIAYYPSDATTLDELISYADYAMYEIKQSTKGKFNEFNSANYANREYRTQNYEKFNILIEKNLVDYNFQPIVNLKTGKILGHEALMRSLDPSFASPLEIINLASAQHKLYYIERLTWFNALQKYIERATNDPTKLLFVNSVPSHILTEEDMDELESKYLDLLSRVVVEFTEAEKLNEDYASRKKEKIKGWGGKIALDDFGAGYSNDAVLLILNPNYIKIDMFIVRDCDTNQSKRKLMQNIVAYASERKIKVIAEGVETKSELETVMRCKVDFVQGYYVARPALFPQEIPQDKQDEILALNAFIKNKAPLKDIALPE